MKKIVVVCIVLLVIVAVIFSAGCFGGSKSTSSSSATVTSTASPVPTQYVSSKDQTYHVGDIIWAKNNIDHYKQLSITEVLRGSEVTKQLGISSAFLADNIELLALKQYVKNIDDEHEFVIYQSISPLYADGKTVNGHAITNKNVEKLGSGSLLPGAVATGWILFEIPKTTTEIIAKWEGYKVKI